jgi:hypothetical protein
VGGIVSATPPIGERLSRPVWAEAGEPQLDKIVAPEIAAAKEIRLTAAPAPIAAGSREGLRT